MSEKSPRSPLAWLLIAIVLAYAGVLIIAPLVTIVSKAFAEGWSPVWQAITAPDAVKALQLTFLLALCAVFINTVLGVVVAWVLARHRFFGHSFFNGLVDLPFVVSPVIIGFVIIVLFGRQGWLKDFPIKIAFAWPGMLLVTIFVSLPFVIREVMPVLASLTPEQEEAARTLGAGRLTIFRRIVFPSIRHSVIYGLVLTLARCLGEFGAATVAGGGIQGLTETATIYIFRLRHDRNPIGAYSMAVVLGLISVCVLIVMNLLRRPSAKKEVSHVDPTQ